MTSPAKQPRLLWITERFHPGRGGMAVSCDRIVHGLRKRGVTVDVVHLKRAPGTPATHLREGGTDRIVPAFPDAPHAMAALWADLEQENAGWTHVVAFGGALPFACAPAYAAWLGVPLVTLLRGNDFDTGLHAPDRRVFLEDAIRRAACVGCVTESQLRRVQRLFPGVATAWTPNGIELAEWQALEVDRLAAKAWREANVPAGRTCIGLVGDLKAKKGVAFFLAALADSPVADRVHLLVAGEVEAGIAEQLAASGRASMCTPVPRTDLIAKLRACDALALPSFYEGFPNLLLEATALGVPVIASEAGAAGVARDGVHGVVFRTGDARACRAAIERFVERYDAKWPAACEQLAAAFPASRETETYGALLAETAKARPAGSEPARIVHRASGT